MNIIAELIMICIVDFDRTFLKNDYFMESFCIQMLKNPFYIFSHFLLERGNLLGLKMKLLKDYKKGYNLRLLINPMVDNWIQVNRSKYNKVVLVSASPDAFVKELLSPLSIFDAIHGSTDVNLKGIRKVEFIKTHYGDVFDYMGDAGADVPVFKMARNAYKVTANKIELLEK